MVTCAVSGGADSLALLVLAVAQGCVVTAVHVDHGLRPESASEADVVADAADRFGAAFVAARAPVAPGSNLEARARAARRAALPDGALTGHTADDQAETVLLNLLWGAGLDGVAGMDPATRPLLALRRWETRSLCRDVGLAPVHDRSNDDLSFRRNRIRHQVLPLLAAAADRDPVPVLARQARLVADDVRLLEELAAAIDPTHVAALAGAPVALARRAIRGWLRDEEGHPPDAGAVERVLDIVHHRASACEVPGGRRVRRSAGRLYLDPL